VAFEYIDVKESSQKLTKMLEHSGGKRKVPVIVESGKVTIGWEGNT
jgi:glutaredoxin 3